MLELHWCSDHHWVWTIFLRWRTLSYEFLLHQRSNNKINSYIAIATIRNLNALDELASTALPSSCAIEIADETCLEVKLFIHCFQQQLMRTLCSGRITGSCSNEGHILKTVCGADQSTAAI